MTRILKVIASAWCFANGASADQTLNMQMVFEEEVAPFDYGNGASGMYTQSWFATRIDAQDSGEQTVYVESYGKLGNFRGVLSVNCGDPTRSKWVALSDTMGADSVPNEAITGIRRLSCPQM